MSMLLEVFLLVVGFVLLIKGADVFVGASVDIAKRLKIPSVIIGLTVVALGTSLPEAVISISAAVGGSNDLAIGNVIGSNIFNLMFIVGFCALIKPLYVKVKEIARDYWVSVGATVLLLLLMIIFTDTIPRIGSFILFSGFVIYMVVLIRKALKNKIEEETEDDTEQSNTKTKSLVRIILFAVLGLTLIIIGGQVTVYSAVNIALTLGITERIVGLTILAVGTSLPEFVTTLIACRKKENDIAIGNIIGSNIFNIMFVLGLSGLIMPLSIDSNLIFDITGLTLGSLVFLLFAHSGKRIVRFEGLSMVIMYAAYISLIIIF